MKTAVKSNLGVRNTSAQAYLLLVWGSRDLLQQSLEFWCRAAVLRTPRCARPHAHQNAPERPPKRASGLQHLSGINVVTHPSNTSLRINVVTQNSNSPFLPNRLGNYPTSASRCTLGQAPPARKPNCSWLGSVPHTGLVALPRHPLLAHINTVTTCLLPSESDRPPPCRPLCTPSLCRLSANCDAKPELVPSSCLPLTRPRSAPRGSPYSGTATASPHVSTATMAHTLARPP